MVAAQLRECAGFRARGEVAPNDRRYVVRAEAREVDGRVTSADQVAIGAGCGALVAGILVLVLLHGTVSMVIGICLLGLSGVAFVALVFLLVGESEDRHYRNGGV